MIGMMLTADILLHFKGVNLLTLESLSKILKYKHKKYE